MSILFVIPTTSSAERYSMKQNCLARLSRQGGISSSGPHGEIIDVEETANIAKKLNRMISNNLKEHEFFCFMHDDMEILDNNWIDAAVKIMKETPRIGQIGVQLHGRDGLAEPPKEMRPVLWADGMYMCSTKLWDLLGGFDEAFVGDCETEDFSRRLIQSGHTNYYVPFPFIHHRTKNYRSKNTAKDFMETVYRSRNLLNDKINNGFYD